MTSFSWFDQSEETVKMSYGSLEVTFVDDLLTLLNQCTRSILDVSLKWRYYRYGIYKMEMIYIKLE